MLDSFDSLDSLDSFDHYHLATPSPPSTLPLFLSPVSCPPPVPKHPSRSPSAGSRYGNRKVGRAVPVTPLRGVTGEPQTRPCNTNPARSATYPPLRELPQSGADIPVCARPRGQTGMSAPHYHAPSLRLAGTASPHLCWRAFAEAFPALDDRRRQATTADNLQIAPVPRTISRLFSARHFGPIPQGVALGWYVSPFQGWHQLCRELCR